MLVLRAYRFRLYPTREQQSLLAKMLGCNRYIWNAMLEERETFYREHGKSIGKARRTEKQWKKIHPFLKQVNSVTLQQARIDLDNAYAAFFRHAAPPMIGTRTSTPPSTSSGKASASSTSVASRSSITVPPGSHVREDRVRPATTRAPVYEPGIHAI